MNGLILSFAGQKRKQLMNGLNTSLKLQKKNYKIIVEKEIQLIKHKGIISQKKDLYQQNMMELLKLKISLNTIYIIIQYDRLDLMIQKLEFLIQYLEFYSHNICLIITGFENSTDPDSDYTTLCDELGNQYKIKNLFVHTYEGQDKITFKPQFESTYQFFYSTLSQNNKIKLNAINMKVQQEIDDELWDRLNKHLNMTQANKQLQVKNSKLNQQLDKPISFNKHNRKLKIYPRVSRQNITQTKNFKYKCLNRSIRIFRFFQILKSNLKLFLISCQRQINNFLKVLLENYINFQKEKDTNN